MQRIDFRVTADLGAGADDQERNDAVAASRRIMIAKQVGTVVDSDDEPARAGKPD